MKKIIFIIFTLFLTINSVKAKENKLSISNVDNKLYYDSKLYDNRTFMQHLDMVPGDNFNDYLIIENETNLTFNLYLKINKKNDNELLNYMHMKLYLDNTLIYDGDLLGNNFNSINNKLNESYLLGKFHPHQLSNLRAETYFSDEYSNTNNDKTLYTEWKFYAETFDDLNELDNVNNEVIEIVPAPITGINIKKLPIIILSIGTCLVGCIIIIILIKKKNKDDKYEKNN